MNLRRFEMNEKLFECFILGPRPIDFNIVLYHISFIAEYGTEMICKYVFRLAPRYDMCAKARFPPAVLCA